MSRMGRNSGRSRQDRTQTKTPARSGAVPPVLAGVTFRIRCRWLVAALAAALRQIHLDIRQIHSRLMVGQFGVVELLPALSTLRTAEAILAVPFLLSLAINAG